MHTALAVHGPYTGVATLQAWCPSASRRAIATWRRQRRRAARQRLHVVRWTSAGRVWAADFSDAPQPIDGDYPCVLHVRDLASQQYLAALPVPHPTASAVCDLLHALVAAHAAPLVLKVDNGAAFGSHQLQGWAMTHGTALLYLTARVSALQRRDRSEYRRARHTGPSSRGRRGASRLLDLC